jgi:hypothetical protein
MGISMSTDFLLGIVVGAILILVIQQLTRATGSIGQFMPLLLIFACAAISFLVYWWWIG